MPRNFPFDAENRISQATVNGTTTLYGYDSEGRRDEVEVSLRRAELHFGDHRCAVDDVRVRSDGGAGSGVRAVLDLDGDRVSDNGRALVHEAGDGRHWCAVEVL